jgi:hypothetical protein
MKRNLLAGFALTVLLALAFFPVGVSAEGTEATITFKATLDPADPAPGNAVTVKLAYEASGLTAPENVDYEIILTPVSSGMQTETAVPSASYSAASGTITIEKDGTGEFPIPFFSPSEESDYKVEIKLTAKSAVLNEGDTTSPNQVSLPASLNVYSALPAGLSQLFAGLGLFAAVMAIMAVGTEVVVEMLKSMVGLKSKVTAMEAFNELKSELPGLLAGAGVDAKARQKITDLVDKTKEMLKPVEDINGIVDKIKAGSFFEAFEALNQLKIGINGSADAQKKLKEDAKAKLRAGLVQLARRMGVTHEMTAAAEEKALKLVDDATAGNIDALIKQVFSALQEMLYNPKEVESWLLGQMDQYLTEGKDELGKFMNECLGNIAGLGIDEASAKKWFEDTLNAVEQTARDKSEVYAHSVRNLLNAVEERRNEVQSPARLFWRRLRDSYLPLWFFDMVLIGVPLGIIFGFAKVNLLGWIVAMLPPNLDVTLSLVAWGAALLSGILVGVILWLLSLLISVTGEESKRMRERRAGPPHGTIGHFLRFTVERLYNRFMGRGSNVVDPVRYGSVDKQVERQIASVGPTTIASTLLTQEDQHQDEETRRVRLIRVISAVIGTILAYYMKIDAAVYLGYAVPDVVQQINRVDFAALHDKWAFIPSDLTIGIILTGLAASAGSKFWRDLLGRLQSAKGQAEEAARMVERVKGTLPFGGSSK